MLVPSPNPAQDSGYAPWAFGMSAPGACSSFLFPNYSWLGTNTQQPNNSGSYEGTAFAVGCGDGPNHSFSYKVLLNLDTGGDLFLPGSIQTMGTVSAGVCTNNISNRQSLWSTKNSCGLGELDLGASGSSPVWDLIGNGDGTATASGAVYAPNIISDKSYDAVIEADPALVAYYSTEESTGTTLTDVKGTNNGTYAGAFTLRAPLGNGLHGVSLDGSTGTFSTPTGVTVTNFTVESIFVNGGNVNSNQAIGVNNSTATSGLGGISNSSQMKLFYANGSQSSTFLALNLLFYQPVLVDYTYDGTNVRIYMNGILTSTTALSVAGSSALTIGTSCLCIVGKPALYNAALTQADIMTHVYAAGLP